ncbi:hypothetical protein RCL_jg29481.t1 [Rhizophagus clarus]|uniref:Uncharacterized protein n=1 Tax=Rhizophagus clarus TaxID=94130 RepID=A0A8H3KXT5_9GLOM|nr:hypothetical protein RCL_jg29481.t1 [Rhizophagus clarus]
MGTWFDYYYKVWASKKPTKLLAQFESYRIKKLPFNNEIYEQFDNDILIIVNIAPPIIESEEQEIGNTEQNEIERILEDLQEISDYITIE